MRWIALALLLLTTGMSQALAEDDGPTDLERGLKAIELEQYDVAWRLLLPLAYSDNPAAQYQIGWLFSKGFGVRKNRCIAVTWYDRSARNGYAYAQLTMASLLTSHWWGTIENNQRAYGWLLLSIQNGIEKQVNIQSERIRFTHILNLEERQAVKDAVENGRFDLKTPAEVYITPFLGIEFGLEDLENKTLCEDPPE